MEWTLDIAVHVVVLTWLEFMFSKAHNNEQKTAIDSYSVTESSYYITCLEQYGRLTYRTLNTK